MVISAAQCELRRELELFLHRHHVRTDLEERQAATRLLSFGWLPDFLAPALLG